MGQNPHTCEYCWHWVGRFPRQTRALCFCAKLNGKGKTHKDAKGCEFWEEIGYWNDCSYENLNVLINGKHYNGNWPYD